MKRRPKEETEALILKTAVTEFSQYGYEATTMKKLQKESGVAIGSMAYKFGDKLGLAEHIYEARVASLAQTLDGAAIRAGTDVGDIAIAIQKAYLDWAKSNPGGLRLIDHLTDVVARPNSKVGSLRQTLERLLAERLVGVRLNNPLEPSQLYAAVILPAHFAALEREERGGVKAVSWETLLGGMAIAALKPALQKVKHRKPGIAASVSRPQPPQSEPPPDLFFGLPPAGKKNTAEDENG